MARYEVVVATLLPRDVERELKRRAHADDRSLSAFLRRTLVAVASAPAAGVETDSIGRGGSCDAARRTAPNAACAPSCTGVGKGQAHPEEHCNQWANCSRHVCYPCYPGSTVTSDGRSGAVRQTHGFQIHHLRQDEARSAALRLVMSHPGKYPASDEEQKYRDGKRHNDD